MDTADTSAVKLTSPAARRVLGRVKAGTQNSSFITVMSSSIRKVSSAAGALRPDRRQIDGVSTRKNRLVPSTTHQEMTQCLRV